MPVFYFLIKLLLSGYRISFRSPTYISGRATRNLPDVPPGRISLLWQFVPEYHSLRWYVSHCLIFEPNSLRNFVQRSPGWPGGVWESDSHSQVNRKQFSIRNTFFVSFRRCIHECFYSITVFDNNLLQLVFYLRSIFGFGRSFDDVSKSVISLFCGVPSLREIDNEFLNLWFSYILR